MASAIECIDQARPSSGELEMLEHIYRREFRVRFRRTQLELVSREDIADLLVWWDMMTELGGWAVDPSPYLAVGIPWAIWAPMIESDGGVVALSRIVRPGELYRENVLADIASGRSRMRTRTWPKSVDQALLRFRVWTGDEAKAAVRFVEIKGIKLVRWTQQHRTFEILYRGWWSVLHPDLFARPTRAPITMAELEALHLTHTVPTAAPYDHVVTKATRGRFQISHLLFGDRFERVEVCA